MYGALFKLPCRKTHEMKCPNCNENLIWGGDHSYEDYGIDEQEGIVSNASCPDDNCMVDTVIVYTRIE